MPLNPRICPQRKSCRWCGFLHNSALFLIPYQCVRFDNLIIMFGVSSAKVQNNYEFESRSEYPHEQRRRNYEGSLENGEVTQFYFKKVKELEISLALIIAVNIYLIVVATAQYFPHSTADSARTLQVCLYFAVICVGAAIILLTMRTLTLLRLQKEQKQLYERATIFSSRKIMYLLFQCLLLLLQPYPFFMDVTIKTENAYNNYPIQYPLNDLLAILSLGRVAILFKTTLVLTPYMDNRANRLCKMYGCRADFSYSLKCLFKEHPLKLIGLCYSLSACLFAYMVYLAERQILVQDGGFPGINAATTYPNALWLILITTTTVGYGDYYPLTPLGRIIILFVAIWGTLIVSIMLVVVTNTLSMENSEIRTAKILEKLELRSVLEVKAARFLGYFLLYRLKRSDKRGRRELARKLLRAKGQFSQLCKQMRELMQFNDLQDEVATHFLKLNSDIETLNNNQDLILSFIHSHFNAQPEAASQEEANTQQLIVPSEQELGESEKAEEMVFMEGFREKVREHQQHQYFKEKEE